MSVYARLRLASSGAQTVHAGEIICISEQPNSRGVFDIQKFGQPILIRTGAQFRRARDVQHVTVIYRGAGHIDMPFSSSTPATALAPLYFDGDAVSADTRSTPIGYALHGCNSDRIHMEIIWDPQPLNFPGTTGFSTDRDVRFLENQSGELEQVDFKTFKRDAQDAQAEFDRIAREDERKPYQLVAKDALDASDSFDEFEQKLLGNLDKYPELANDLVRITSPGTNTFEQLKEFFIERRLKRAKFYLYAAGPEKIGNLTNMMPDKIVKELIEKGLLIQQEFYNHQFTEHPQEYYDLLHEALKEAILNKESIDVLADDWFGEFQENYTSREVARKLLLLLKNYNEPSSRKEGLEQELGKIANPGADSPVVNETIGQTAKF